MTRAGALAALLCLVATACPSTPSWSDADRARLLAMRLTSFDPPADPTNAVADTPAAAVLGKRLFEDTGFSMNGRIACATCHDATKGWGDGLPTAEGLTTGSRNTHTILGSPWAVWLFWDGSKDSQWSQALGPVENPVEHAYTRTQVVRRLFAEYRTDYEALFGALPDLDANDVPVRAMPVPADTGDPRHVAWSAIDGTTQTAINRAFSNFGKAIAAYERTIALPRTPFDDYLDSLATRTDPPASFNDDAIAGLALFLGKANCTACHVGPRLTDDAFHNLGLTSATSTPDRGRALGAKKVLGDTFNCLGDFSDSHGHCDELRYLDPEFPDFEGAFRTPSLRSVADTAPYMHDGRFPTLDAVLEFYSTLPDGTFPGHRERLMKPLQLTDDEKRHLLAFLHALSPTPTP